MYLVFQSVNPTINNSPVYGVEFCNGVPSFVTKESAYAYVDIGDGTSSAVKTKVDQILANIDETSIKQKVNTIISCALSDVTVNGTSPSRKIDPEDWRSTVKPAWYRSVAYTDHAVI